MYIKARQIGGLSRKINLKAVKINKKTLVIKVAIMYNQ